MNVDDKLNGFYRGQVVEHLTHGYCRIFIPGIYPEYFKQHKDMIPPAEQAASLFGGANDGSGMFTYPNINSIVWCFFANGDQNFPIYFAASLGGQNAFGQYQIIKTPKELCATKHLITSGKTQIELFENGKAYCVVKDPDRRPAIVDYKSLDDVTKLLNDSVSAYTVATSAENLQISSIDCQFALDNDMSCHGLAQMKTQFYDINDKDQTNDYTLSIVNNCTMTNDGEIQIDSTSSYIGKTIVDDDETMQNAHIKNNIDMSISAGISIQNSLNVDSVLNSTQDTTKKESYNTFIVNDTGIHEQTTLMNVHNDNTESLIDSEKSNVIALQQHPGSIMLCATYDKNYNNGKSGKNHTKNTRKTFELGNAIQHAISSNVSCNAIQTVMSYQTSDKESSNSQIKKLQYNVTDSNAVFDATRNTFCANDHVMSYNLTSDNQNNLNVSITKHEGSDGNIINVLKYNNVQGNNTQTTTASQALTKDQGFNTNIDIEVKGTGTNIKSSAQRVTFASSKGSTNGNSNDIVSDGFAFDEMKLTSKVNQFGFLETNCVMESVHDTQKSTYTEKVTNNIGSERCNADITINAKKGTIVMSIDNSKGESSNICLDKLGNITLTSSKTIQLNAPLVVINGQQQVDIRSKNGVVRNIANKVSSQGKAIWLYSPKGAIQMDSVNGSRTV